MKKDLLGLHSKDTFQKDSFFSPDVQHAPMYVWMWNGKVSREETDRQLEEMHRLGIRAMYILPEPKSFRPNTMPTMLEPDYLTKPYFEEFLYATRKAAEMGMTMWLYDEGGWPSGGACGKVLLQYPEYAKKYLASRQMENADGESITEYYSKTSLFENAGHPDFPDLTRKEATEAFIEIGLESYKPYLQKYFGKDITMVFTDEPSMSRPVPFREELEAKFEEINGYSIKPYLPELSGDKPVTDKNAALARIAWYDLCSQMFCENFLLVEKEWANQNGMAFTGHFGGEDQIIYCVKGGYGHIMKALRCLDIPGVDAIWRQIFPAEAPSDFHPVTGVSGENRFFPRFASSAAAQTGKKRVMTESCGVYGEGLTFDEMRYVFNFQAVRGVNIFNLFSVPYAREGFLMTGELPYITEKHACYKDLPAFNTYLEKLSYITSIGQMDNQVALYMPVWDIWAGEDSEYYGQMFEKIGKEMEAEQIMFDVFDDEVLVQADRNELAKGIVSMGDVQYNTLVFPPCKYMPDTTKEKLEVFTAGGGKVFFVRCDQMPALKGTEIVDSICGKINSQIEITGDNRLIRVGARKLDNGKVYFINNERVSDACFGVSLDGVTIEKQDEKIVCADPYTGNVIGNLYGIDLYSGTIYLPQIDGGEIKISLESGEMAVLLRTEDTLHAEAHIYDKEICILTNDFTFKRTNRFIVGEKTYQSEDIEEKKQPVLLGDWSAYVGKAFSGSGIYEKVFTLADTGKKLCLDLGEVHYTCEVFINGHSLGVKVMAPYRYEIPTELLKTENVLQVRVSNTPANEYTYTKSFDKWQSWQLSPYWPKEKRFQSDSLSGGLYGPVRLLEEV